MCIEDIYGVYVVESLSIVSLFTTKQLSVGGIVAKTGLAKLFEKFFPADSQKDNATEVPISAPRSKINTESVRS